MQMMLACDSSAALASPSHSTLQILYCYCLLMQSELNSHLRLNSALDQDMAEADV